MEHGSWAPNGHILLNDVEKNVLVEFAGPPREIIETTPYNQDWRMGELVIVPAQHEHAFLKAAAAITQ